MLGQGAFLPTLKQTKNLPSLLTDKRGELHVIESDDGKARKAYTQEDTSIDLSRGDFDGKNFCLTTSVGARGNIL